MRPILTTRNPGIERLIASLPFAPDNPNDLRHWTANLTADAGRFEVAKAKEKSLNRLASSGGRRP